jgi:hypothetical protein
MSVADNFDNSIPTLNRSSTMYLSSINSKDVKMRPFKKLYTLRDWSTNTYNLDIESSMPRSFGIFTNKVDFINKVDDIEKTSPKILNFPLNKPEYNLSNKDIEKSSPNAVQFKTLRKVNPLQPKYNLSKLEDYPPEIPRFIRDSIDISDIPGANPKKQNFIKIKENLSEKLNNIEGSKPRIPYYRKNIGKIKYHYLDYSDLNSYIFKTKRNTNALDPIYIFKNKTNDGTINYLGPIEKSKPRVKYPYYYEYSNLKVDDIEGSNPGSKNFINKFTGNDFYIRIEDIEKSGAGSLKKGIITKRCINPLMPKYQYPGEKESKDPIFNINKKKLNFRSSSVPKMIGTKQLSNDSTKINEKDENKNIEEKAKSTLIANNENDNNNKKINKKNYSICYESNVNCIDNNSNKNKSKTPLLGLTKNNNIDNNSTFKIDRTKYGKKPTPFYGFSHDPFLQSSENLEHLNEIENNKRIKEMRKKILSQKILENDKNYIANEYKKNPNSMFLSNNDTYSLQNKKLNRSGSFTNAIGTFRERINKSTNQFGPPQKTYVEQLEKFLNKNTIQKQFEQKKSYPIQSQKIHSSKETKKALLE